MELNYIDIGKRIRSERKRQNLSQDQLAEMAEISTTHMSHIETANTKLSLPVLIKLANSLHVSTDALVCDNTVTSKAIYHNQIADVLSQCDEKQIRIISDIVLTTKKALDKNL
ncbi:helix-turn-helix domain-containing protein [Christensenellaceae bacterium OttesenSCG-928-M15]|nr:helix-turn-helix domain-containing protein [Christensenellaceae bacterium OttesenSCG-928-M15]